MRAVFFLGLLAVSTLLLAGCVGGGQFVATSGWAGPVPSAKLVYLGSREGKLLALDAATGERRFTFPVEEKEQLQGIYGTPILADGHLLVGDYRGKLYSLDASDLSQRWRYPADERYLGHLVGGPTVAEDRVVFGSSDGFVRALNEGGGLEWEVRTAGMVWATPTVERDTVYVGSLGHYLYAFSLKDGQPKWPSPFGAGGAVATSPLVADGKVFVGSFDRIFYAVDASTGKEVWRFDQGKAWYWGGPVTDGRRVYAAALDGIVYALDVQNGTKRWEFDLQSPTISTPAILGDRLVVASDGGLIYVLSTETGAQVAPSFNVGAQVRAPLIARDGVVYINAMDHRVWALRVVGRQEKVWEISTKTKK